MILRNIDDERYQIDTARKVFVYKNLHKDCWSIKQNGLVKAHTDETDVLNLYQCSFRVNYKGRKRVLKEKRKNVHAGGCGYLSHPESCYKTWDDAGWWELSPVTYDPYKYSSFVHKRTKKPIWSSPFVKMYTHEVRAISKSA